MYFVIYVIIPIIYILFDVHYYTRGIYVILSSRLWKKKMQILDSSEITGIVLPSDGDFYFTHMNNARCFREFDFGRYDNVMRNGLYEFFKNDVNKPVIAAHCIRYRQPIWMFSLYKVTTANVYWDSKAMYIEQKIITLSDGIIRCVGYVKVAYGCCIEEKIENELPFIIKPDPPEDLLKWIEYNARNSKKINGINRSLITKPEENDCCENFLKV